MNLAIDGLAALVIAGAVVLTLYVGVRHGVLVRVRHDTPKDDDET